MASNMDKTMDKMAMSLDEIIKSSKTGTKSSPRGKAKTKVVGKKAIKSGGVSKRASMGKKQQTRKQQSNRASNKAKAGGAKDTIVKRGRKQIRQQPKKKATSTAATKQLVQKLVKKALAKSKVGRRSIVRTPIKSSIRRRVTGRIGGRVGGSIVRGRIGKKQNIVQSPIMVPRMIAQRPRIIALPAVNQRLVHAPMAYSMVETLPIPRRRRQRNQFYQPQVAQQFIGEGSSIRSQVSAMRRRVVYVQPPVQKQFVMQPMQSRQRVVQYQRPPPQQYVQRFVQPQVVRRPQRNRQGQQQSRGQQQRRVIKAEDPFYDPPNFLQRI